MTGATPADGTTPPPTPPAPPPFSSEEIQARLDQLHADQNAADKKAGLADSVVGMLPLMMGYDTYEPPPPPPPPPPTTTMDGPVSKDDIIDITGDSGEPPPPPPPPNEPPTGAHLNDPAAPTFSPAGWTRDSGATPKPSGTPSWLIPAVIAVLVLLGAIGVAITRPSEPSAAPAPLATPESLPTAPARSGTFTLPPTPVLVAVTRVAMTEAGNVCLNPTTLTVVVQAIGVKAGDSVHLVLNGPGLPDQANAAPMDSSGTSSTVVGTVGPVKGRQVWEASVDQIGGKPVVGPKSIVVGACPP